MFKKTLVLLMILSLTLWLCSCAREYKNSEFVLEANESLSSSVPQNLIANASGQEAYTLYYTHGCRLSLYEPKSGIYAGANMIFDKSLSSFASFEDKTKSHAMYVYELELGKEVPVEWILGMAAKDKIPFFLLTPPLQNPFDRALLQKTAQALGEYKVPVLVELYHDPKSLGLDPNDYLEFFKVARASFDRYAPNAALVFGLSSTSIDSLYYDPGEAADWAAISLVFPVENGSYSEALMAAFDYFYNLFQKDKPIAVFIAVSHFSTKEYSYYTKEAAAKIQESYKQLSAYPRVKAINYLNYSEIDFSGTENYLITDQEEITKAYTKALNGKFLSEVEVSDSKNPTKTLLRSPFKAFKIDSEIYISELSLQYDFNVETAEVAMPKNFLTIDGEKHYKLKELKVLGLEAEAVVNEAEKTIKLLNRFVIQQP